MQAIVAADNNWGIGYQNRLLVSIPSDMKFFRQKTTGNVVVMGRKTLESFPNGLPLKNRVNISGGVFRRAGRKRGGQSLSSWRSRRGNQS